MADRNWDRIVTQCGVVAPIVALGTIVLATLVASPETFTWRDRALSELGRYGAETFWLFNGGLILGGLFGLPFTWGLWTDSRRVLERIGTALLGLSVVGMIGVGVFFLDHTTVYLDRNLHPVAAVTFFGVAPFAQWIYGSGQVLAGDRALGLVSIWLGIVHPLTWLAWLLARAGSADPWVWFAVPEFITALAFGCWILVVAVDRSTAIESGIILDPRPSR